MYKDFKSKKRILERNLFIDFICLSYRYALRVKAKQSCKLITKKQSNPKDEYRGKREDLISDKDKYALFKEQNRIKQKKKRDPMSAEKRKKI